MLKPSQVLIRIKVILSVENISTWVGVAHKSMTLSVKTLG